MDLGKSACSLLQCVAEFFQTRSSWALVKQAEVAGNARAEQRGGNTRN
jgi:hypothetical protein